jgi:hypothetical protein
MTRIPSFVFTFVLNGDVFTSSAFRSFITRASSFSLKPVPV